MPAIVLIYTHHNESGLPAPMSALGQYEKNGKTVQLFRAGDICIRDGAQNAFLRWSHWNELLREHDQRIRDDARKDIESLVAEVVKSLRNPDGRSNVPLSIEMSDDTFAEALLTNIELNRDTRIRYFLSQLSGFTADEERYIEALNKATIVAVQALFLGETEIVDLTIKRLFDMYKQLNPRNPSKQLEVIVRCYIIGAAAVRCEAWSTISNLVLQPYPPKIDAFTYVYTSWIRHGQVQASRAELFPADDRGSLMIPLRGYLSSSIPRCVLMYQTQYPLMQRSSPKGMPFSIRCVSLTFCIASLLQPMKRTMATHTLHPLPSINIALTRSSLNSSKTKECGTSCFLERAISRSPQR